MSRLKNEDFQQAGVKDSVFSVAAFHLLSRFSRGHTRTGSILSLWPKKTANILPSLLSNQFSPLRIRKILYSQTCLIDEIFSGIFKYCLSGLCILALGICFGG